MHPSKPKTEGKCASCKKHCEALVAHGRDKHRGLCPECLSQAEEERLLSRSGRNPIGHALRPKDVKELVLEELEKGVQVSSRSTFEKSNTIIRLMQPDSIFMQLACFLEAQLAPCFSAFKQSTAWKGFTVDAPSEAPSDADDKHKTLGPLAEADAKLANVAASDSYADYVPAKLNYGPPHVEHVVESASLACVAPVDVTYTLALPEAALSSGVLSRVQLEGVIYALQQHEKRLPVSGCRAGFFIGDGTGVGKGRELAAMIWDNWLRGRTKACWFTCNTDLAVDARRDLDDIGARCTSHASNRLRRPNVTPSLVSHLLTRDSARRPSSPPGAETSHCSRSPRSL